MTTWETLQNKKLQFNITTESKPRQVRKWLRLVINAPGASHRCTVFNSRAADSWAMAGNVPRTSWNLHHACVHISARLVRCTHLAIKPPRCIACENLQKKVMQLQNVTLWIQKKACLANCQLVLDVVAKVKMLFVVCKLHTVLVYQLQVL